MPNSSSCSHAPEFGDLAVMNISRARKHKRCFGAVITLEDPNCRHAAQLRFHRQPAPAHLVVQCEDVDDDTLGIQVATRAQVVAAIEFARLHCSASLLVHCFHGVGRSAAVGVAILADRLGAGHEQVALSSLLAIRPEATPNLVIIKLADDILGLRGRLITALATWEADTPRVQEKRAVRRAFIQANPHLYAWLQPVLASV